MRTRRSPSLRRRGLTLIEVLIVIAILLAIGGLVYVNLMPAKEGADRDTQRLQIQQISGAMKMFKLHMKRYPSEEEGLSALVRKDAIQDETEAAQWQGPYLESAVIKDKWNHELVYHFPGSLVGETEPDIISLGPDGQEGGGDDITNHDDQKGADGEFAKDGDSFSPAPSGGSGESKGGS